MRNGRGPRTILRFIAIIAMNLFTINCACYIAVTVSAHADPRLLHLSRTVGTLCGMMAIAITPILLITVLVNGMEEGKKRHEENNDGAGRGICRPTQRHPAEHKRGREHARTDRSVQPARPGHGRALHSNARGRGSGTHQP